MVARLSVSAFVLTMALLVSPVAANACPSLAGVKSFRGSTDLSFRGTASYQGETISLDRAASDLNVTLIRRGGAAGLLLFAGTVSGGHVSVHDSFMNAT